MKLFYEGIYQLVKHIKIDLMDGKHSVVSPTTKEFYFTKQNPHLLFCLF